MGRVFLATLTAGLLSFSSSSWAQNGNANACDLTQDGAVNVADWTLAINMALGLSPCAANIEGAGVCDVVVVQRVINASLGGACVTGQTGKAHSVSVSWVASISTNLAGYNLYRALTPFGPYTRLNLAVIGGTTYTDGAVQAGQTYYYSATAVDTSGNESVFSDPPIQATIPNP